MAATSTMPASNDRSLRNAFGSFATGVTIVTTHGADGRDIGLTANSFSSVSLSPPMILWSLASSSSSIDVFRDANHFAVHILAADQEALSTRFATKGIDRFAGIETDRGPSAIPLLEGCSARFVCRTAFQYEGGDHVIFVGEVLEFAHSDKLPLVFHGGRYSRLLRKERATPAPLADASIGPTSDDLIHGIAQAYHAIRREATIERQRLGWSELDYVAISVLGWKDDCSLADIDSFARSRGLSITPDMVSALIDKGVMSADGPIDADTRLTLTEAGRQSVIALVAMLKSAEADAVAGLDPSEVEMLKQLLRKVSAA